MSTPNPNQKIPMICIACLSSSVHLPNPVVHDSPVSLPSCASLKLKAMMAKPASNPKPSNTFRIRCRTGKTWTMGSLIPCFTAGGSTFCFPIGTHDVPSSLNSSPIALACSSVRSRADVDMCSVLVGNGVHIIFHPTAIDPPSLFQARKGPAGRLAPAAASASTEVASACSIMGTDNLVCFQNTRCDYYVR